MPPHPGHQRIPPPLTDGLGDPSHEFDTTLLRKEKDAYEGYNFERINPQQPNEKATWAIVTKTMMPLSQSELLAMVNKQKRKGTSAWQLLKSDEMRGFKRKQVDRLIDDRLRADPRFEFELAGLKLDQYNDRRGGRGTSAFQVILRRHVRKESTGAGPAGLGKLHDSRREIVDLTGGSEDPSEGSSRDFFGGHSPPPNRFVPPPPHHGFQDPHGSGQQHHQPPLVHHPGPPMHEVHHEVHRGSPPPHHLPQFEESFIHQDPHHHHPSTLFHQHLHPQMAPTAPMPPHNGQREKHLDVKEGKQMKDSKGSKDSKPKIHQVMPQKPEKKHRKAPSDSDWDYLSESSGSSLAYTDRTPDTSYSSNSSRRDKKTYHKGKDSRRSSHSHHDEYRNDRTERNEPVYRVHRRKPTLSPNRSGPTGHSRHDVEEVKVIPAMHMHDARPYLTRSRTSAQRSDRLPEHYDRAAFEEVDVIPATYMRDARPYLTRSRTSAHRSDPLPEHFDRPTFHSRHMSYEDDHQRFRGPTPPGRRASVYIPKRTMALDLYDTLEQQELIEKEDIKRELLREERRKEELRESVARELEREAQEMRRPIGRERGLSRDRLYDERPRRYSRGYDNERFMY
ncbi:MAG: hypothetical protein Q9184_000931 [Pyrenodesmia sp. 2 TL-2023]